MIRKISRLNEEIARWAFEIQITTTSDWYIAFTNPTAGPWKTIKAQNSLGVSGEVYRFQLEEDRPDIIMYNDILKTIIIFEAKDSIEKLFEGTQMEKSSDVFIRLSDTLKSSNNPFLGERKNYKIVLGLLWGAEGSNSIKSQVDSLFDAYHRIISRNANVYSNLIIGIESRRINENIKCFSHYKSYQDEDITLVNELIKSINS